MAGANKSRRGAADATATATSKALLLRDAVSATKEYTVAATSTVIAQNLVRPMVLALVLLVLIWLALTFLSRYQLWMTAAGVFMVLLSVASAVQEFTHPTKAAQSYQDLLDETVESCSADMISLPSMEPPTKVATKSATTKSATPVAANHTRRGAASPVASLQRAKAPVIDLNAASPAIVTNPVLLESGGVSELTAAAPKASSTRRRKSEDCVALEPAVRGRRNSASEVANKLLVLHCGTVIDIEGSHGFLIPHDLAYDGGFKTVASKKKSRASAAAPRPPKLPLVIPFDLNDDDASVRHELAVGRTVEFAFSEPASDCKVCALHVTPVASHGEIAKSRHALLSCKQAREQSFARAMCDLKMISPRNEPVKHVDLIKYAERLDDHELPFDQFI